MDISTYCLEWFNINYDEQLSKKMKKMKHFFPENDAKILPSPIVNYYRNKLRFDIGFSVDGKITIGYAIPKRISKERYIYDSKNMLHLHPKMKDIIYWLEDHLNKSIKPWYSLEHNKSILYSCTIRTSFNTNDSMLILNTNYSNYHGQEIIQYFTEIDSSRFDELNILIKFSDNYHIIRGKDYIYEKLNNYLFKISSESFFQVNTYATELLYGTIKQLVLKYFNKCDNNILFDLCCGTGTIGTYVADIFTQIIGIDIKSSSISDAIINQKINNINNAHFICAPIEEVLDNVINDMRIKYDNPNFFAIVDPPRTGMHGDVQNVINNCEGLNYLIYVSCNVATLKRDMKILSNCFDPIETIYVDLFPHTSHCEVIMVLRRK
ncbi:putative RNA methyltransferase [Moumouvirus australiensis]|uniref:Putative RNA methyltransferase n=1 Tax=Moumouvirus australiensis TaxID=2109587 RepID=A0A2P1ELP3_9VIRU|nr:putative RNA methyltransferase [Moumouvirus australiensis]AVL94800.1 putative RNA methyltransferase [Moumouvirus australiensis]